MEAEKYHILLFGESRLIPHFLLGGSRKNHILLFGGFIFFCLVEVDLFHSFCLVEAEKNHILLFGENRLIPHVLLVGSRKKIIFFCLVEVD